MNDRLNRDRADLDGIARRMAECASRIKSKIDSFGVEDSRGDFLAQGIVQGLLNARIAGAVHESAIRILDDTLPDGNHFDNLTIDHNVPEVNISPIMAALAPDIRVMEEFLHSIDLERVIKEGGFPGSLDEGVSNLYERFLQKYAPIEKSARGVFYTPGSVARFIVRLVDDLLKEKLGFEHGLADGSVVDGHAGIQLLDPATGTGTFPLHVLELLESKGYERVPPILGVELMPVPLALARMRCNARITGSQQSRTMVSCPTFVEGNVFGFDLARFEGFSVIIGNPPYARSSRNKGTRVDALLDDYKREVRGDRNIQALSDDYVKFIKIGQDIITNNGFGIMAFVVNHTFLRGPIFRGMRRSLMASFDELYIVDLHGNGKIQENVPPGIVDQNVFPIQQGTCIFAAVKARKKPDGGTVIFHHEIYGNRTKKFAWLEANDYKSTPWSSIVNPREPLLRFSPEKADDALLAEYDSFTSIADIFIFNSVGGKPGDDDLLVSFDREGTMSKVRAFIQGSSNVSELSGLTEAKRKILSNMYLLHADVSQVILYNYRPFDMRYSYYHERAWTRPVSRAKQQCRSDNVVLLTTKLVKDREFNHAFVSNVFTDVIFLSNTSSTNCFLFPARVIAPDGHSSWNLSDEYQAYLERMGVPLDEGDIVGALGYIYAMLWSRSFKRRFNACLKDGAPRIPLIEDPAFHGEFRALGKDLVSLHLLVGVDDAIDWVCNIGGSGSNVVERMPEGRYFDDRLHINPHRYFSPVIEETYGFRVGKYAVLRKWLDCRVGKPLDASDIRHVQVMVHVINRSNELIKIIDKIIDSRGVLRS